MTSESINVSFLFPSRFSQRNNVSNMVSEKVFLWSFSIHFQGFLTHPIYSFNQIQLTYTEYLFYGQ